MTAHPAKKIDVAQTVDQTKTVTPCDTDLPADLTTKVHVLSKRQNLPSVDRLLAAGAAAELIVRFGRGATLAAVRESLSAARLALKDGGDVPDEGDLLGEAERQLHRLFAPSLRVVLNLTGTVLHTNLGRALLPQEAADAVARVLTQASNLEYDVASGKRASGTIMSST